MTSEELNTALYHKMYAEQERFKAYLMSTTPHEVLELAYEYVCREDILLCLENNDLSARHAEALIKSDTPLSDVFAKWESWDNKQMRHILECAEHCANEVLRAKFAASKQEER